MEPVNADPSMALPPGKTCGDCAHISRCLAFGFSWRSRTECDFAPSRFLERPTKPERPAGAYVSPLDPPPGDPRAAHVVEPGTKRCAPSCPCRRQRLNVVGDSAAPTPNPERP